MRVARLALAAAFVPLAVLMRWDAPAALEDRPEQGATHSAGRPAAPAPHVVPRSAWGADEKMVREPASHMRSVKAVFVHHTNHPNSYDCDDVRAMLRGLEAAHVWRMGWDDVGYNFVVDRCGTVYEGRGGAADDAVKGAHTRGFNARSTGIAALGTFDAGTHVPRKMLEAIAAVAAWQLEPGADPGGKVRLRSTNSESRVPEGSTALFDVISGHRDGYETQCPGEALYDALPWLRENVARRRS